MDKEKLTQKVNENMSIRNLSAYFDVSYTTIRYWLKKFNLKSSGFSMKNNWEENKLRTAVLKSECKSDVLRILGIKIKSGNFQTLDRYCKLYNIDIQNLKYKNNRGGTISNLLNEEIFVDNSKSTSSTIKRRIKKDKLIPYKCKKCTNYGFWNNEPLTLQLDHINGINNDHRLKNLRFLCPNCHSQTPTFNRRKQKK